MSDNPRKYIPSWCGRPQTPPRTRFVISSQNIDEHLINHARGDISNFLERRLLHQPYPNISIRDEEYFPTAITAPSMSSSGTSYSGPSSGMATPRSSAEMVIEIEEESVDLDNLINSLKLNEQFEFLYLVPLSSETNTCHQPYTYEVTSFNQITNKFYLTISKHGVITHDGPVRYFTPIDEWQRDFHFYQRLVKINFFSTFRMMKTLFLWKRCISYKRVLAMKNLVQNCFFINANIRDTHCRIVHRCLKMDRVSFPEINKVENFNLLDFMLLQFEKLDLVIDNLTDFNSQIVGHVYHACSKELEKLETQRLQNKKKNPLSHRSSTELTYLDQLNRKRLCSRLCRYIYLVSTVLNGLYCKALRTSYLSVHKAFQRHIEYFTLDKNDEEEEEEVVVSQSAAPPKWPFFKIKLVPEESFLTLEPSPSQFIDAINTLLNRWVTGLLNLPKLSANPKLTPITRPTFHDYTYQAYTFTGPSLEFAIETDDFIEEQGNAILHLLTENLDNIDAYLDRLAPIHEFYIVNLNGDKDELKCTTDPSMLRDLLNKFHSQIEAIDTIPDTQSLGLFLLQLDEFKSEVLPLSNDMLKTVEQNITALGAQKILELSKECARSMRTLQREPKATADTVAYLDFLSALSLRFEVIDEQVKYVDEIYNIVEEYEVPCGSDDLEAHAKFKIQLGLLQDLSNKKIFDEKNDIIAKLDKQINKDIKNLASEILGINEEIKQAWLISVKSKAEECVATLHLLSERLMTFQKRAFDIIGYQKKFQLPLAEFAELDACLSDLKMRQLLWETYESWCKALKQYQHGDFNSLDPDSVSKFVAQTLKSVNQIDRYLGVNEITTILKNVIGEFQKRIPVLVHLRNPALKLRHWLQIEEMLDRKFPPGESFTLNDLESCGVLDHVQDLEILAGQASSEAGLENLLKKVESQWENLDLPVVHYRDFKDVFVLGGLDEVQQVLDESFISINTILSSKDVGPIKSRVQTWHKSLVLFSKTMEEWTSCQTNWMYLESIFSTSDIQRQLPVIARQFVVVDRTWKDIMRRTKENPLAMQAVTKPGTLEALENNNKLIDQILKCLEAYLESKRLVFPRFYFLSNEELLEILAQSRNPLAVQPHLRKCFDAIKELEFVPTKGSTTLDIAAMISHEGEKVPLYKVVKARGNVEDWLSKVEEFMVTTLKKLLKIALTEYEKEVREKWIFDHPAQIILTASQIIRCNRVHTILDDPNKNSIEAMKKFERADLNELNMLAGMVQGILTPLNRATLCSLITIDVHAKDTISHLVADKVTSSGSFEWLKCLRYYWIAAIEECVVRMSTASISYSYEYLGVSTRLVLTPLTDKCYLCLMGAIQHDLGGAPSGPAGTGKTETTKDFAKAVAVHCVVFNCSSSLDYKIMGKFFSGLAQAGSWCCFDEFNRIDIEVLSVIAQQLLTIRNAKVAKVSRFIFEGREMRLQNRCSVFITMNPGYAGRTELPDNLKALFRPMAMMIPDYALIAEVVLYSEGFTESKVLANKVTQMYKLCSEQLSQQNHYDFGMRALKSVLAMAGRLKRNNVDVPENLIMIRALRDSNEPKFLAEDNILFQGIMSDLFPLTAPSNQNYGALDKAITFQLLLAQLQPEPCIIQKVIQLYETMVVRHGVMLVGPTGGGKSTILKTLKLALTKLYFDGVEHPDYLPVRTFIMNPKAITIDELYGAEDPLSLKWKDGVLGMAVRNAVQSEEKSHNWIVCDGPVDADWIENLNTVLDDNKTLCLANSERIRLKDGMCMVFEVQDLDQASPATVSRCGIIYVDPNELKWLPYVKSWLTYSIPSTTLTDEDKKYLLVLFEVHVTECLAFVSKHCTCAIQQVDLGKITALCDMFYALILSFCENQQPSIITRRVIIILFAFSLLWAVGGNVDESGRPSFEKFMKDSFRENPEIKINENMDLWNSFLHRSGSVSPWTELMPQFEYDPELPFFDILVPTKDTIRYAYLMNKYLSVSRGVAFIGKTGVGKSVIANSVISGLSAKDGHVTLRLNFSAQTSSFRTQQIIEGQLDKKRKNLLGAPTGKKVYVFIDDVNMPAPDLYGSQPPVELLRQYLDYGGLYDREKLFWKEIKDVVICIACGPPGGGRHHLPPRFMRHFAFLEIQPASDESLKTIFENILGGFFSTFTTAIQNLREKIVNCAIAIFRKVESMFLPTPSKSHYIFNLRDLSKCIQGVLQATPSIFPQAPSMLRLFYHECLRVFQDRLNCVEDKFSFFTLMREACYSWFGSPILDVGTSYDTVPTLIFGDFMTNALNEKDYKELTSMDKIKNMLEDYMNAFNLTTNQPLELVLFSDALQHCCRIARILRAERGNGLLVGVSGTGKQSLTKLASYLNGHRYCKIKITENYNMADFHNDLRLLYWNAGIEETPVTFLLGDNQIILEEMLESINNILNTGEVVNLFEGEEYEKVIQWFNANATDIPDDTSREDIFHLFITRAKQKLHIILTMSPVGDAFRRRCRMFPSLVNSCTIDWFLPWPIEALHSVAHEMLKDRLNETIGVKIYPVCVRIHTASEEMSVRLLNEKRRYFYCTPSSYLQLLRVFTQMLSLKSDEIKILRDRFSNGLLKLYETNAVVASMKAELVAYEPLLAKKSEAASELMKYLSKEQAAADNVRKVVAADEAAAKKKAAQTQILADDAQKDLNAALPAIENAMKALDALNKTDIAELRVFNKPPNLVRVVMEAVCLLFGVKQDWGSAKLFLSDVNLFKKLRDFDKDHVSSSMLKVLRSKYTEHPDFVPDKVATQSKVCRSLCMWVKAMDLYARAAEAVEPKRKALDVAETELNTIRGVLKEKQMQLAEVEGAIAGLEGELDAAVAEKKGIEDAISLTTLRLNRSSRLTSALGEEKVRWEEQVQVYTEKLQNMVGDILLSAGSVAYIGPFPSDFRHELTQIWIKCCIAHELPVSMDYSITTSLSDPFEIRSWIALGLPEDTLSAENAVLVTRSGRWPLMIDPQGQANHWVRSLEGPKGLRILRSGNASTHHVLKSAIRTGQPVLIEDMGESIDPSLMPLLRNKIFRKGGVPMIQYGDSEIEYDRNFQLYLTTKLQNPHYLPEICILMTIVNFSITIRGMEEQLLSEVVRLERPDLENTRAELITKMNADKLQLKNIEEKILRLLYGVAGNILDDEELIDTLNESRETTEVTAVRLEESEVTEQRISLARDRYRPVATRGAIIQSTVLQLAYIDPMYQYSISYLSQIFSGVISKTEALLDVDEKVSLMLRDVTLAIFKSVSRGLFESHKLLFAFLLCTSIERHAGVVSNDYYQFLLRGPNLEMEYDPNPYKDVENSVWFAINSLAKTFPKLELITKGLTDIKFTVGNYVFKPLIDRYTETGTDWNKYLNDFEKILIIKLLKEENLVAALLEYIKLHLGTSYVESPPNNLMSLYSDTSTTTPLIFVLSTGSDPFSALLKFAAELGFSEKLQTISLGQGQGPIAEKMITDAAQKGDWVFLQNCHLSVSWMDSLERRYQILGDGTEKVNPDFRLFLSSMPFEDFPKTILQNAVKVTNEPPRGIRANVQRSLSLISKEFFEDSPLQKKWRIMVYGLCFFHAFVQERKNYGALGWNIPYEFNDSDMDMSLNSLSSFCVDSQIPWDALQYISSEIIYGGRVTDPWDLRCLKTAFLQFFSPTTMVPGYKYSASGIYVCPESKECCTLSAYQQYVETLPIDESAEVYGLSENANTTYKTQLSKNLLTILLDLEPKTAIIGKNTDDVVSEITTSLQSKLVDRLNTEEVSPDVTKKDTSNRISPFTTILFQEVTRYNNLLNIIKTTMSDLKKAISGEVVISELLEDVYTSFLNNKIPKSWETAAYPSLMPLGGWVKDLTLRVNFMQSWLKNGLPGSFWIPGFFFPQGLLTAAIQVHSRQFQIPIDQLHFQFKVLDRIINQENFELIAQMTMPKLGIHVHGLYLEAARWNTSSNYLEDPRPGEMFSSLPMLMLLPKELDEIDTSETSYKCPLYRTANRAGILSTTGHSTNFVIAVDLRANQESSHWILMGTALLMQLIN